MASTKPLIKRSKKVILDNILYIGSYVELLLSNKLLVKGIISQITNDELSLLVTDPESDEFCFNLLVKETMIIGVNFLPVTNLLFTAQSKNKKYLDLLEKAIKLWSPLEKFLI